MPFTAAAGVARVTFNFEDTAGNTSVNVIHCRINSPPITLSNLNDLLEGLEVWFNAYWDTMATNQVRLTSLEARDLTSEFSFYAVRDTNVVGTGTDNMMSPTDTVAISLRTGYSGRSRRGRLYHVGLGEGAQDGGYLSETAITNFTENYELLRTQIEGIDWEWGILSYVENGAPRVTPLFTPITSILITDPVVDHQIRRKPRA